MASEESSISKRERTRRRLVEAAAEVFAEKGFFPATLDEVAARAGLTKGAIYGNFRSKEELLEATFRLPAFGVHPQFKTGASLKEQLRILGEAVVAFAPVAERRRIRVSDFQLYITTHPEAAEGLARRTEEMVDRLTAAWSRYFDEAELGMDIRSFVIVTDALIDGLLIQRSMTPGLVTDDLIIRAFEALTPR